MDNIPKHIVERQIGVFGCMQDAKEFVRKQLHRDGYDWKTVNSVMARGTLSGIPYGIYADDEYDEEDGSLIDNHGYIVYLKSKR
jgi:butyrate kinase